MSPNDLKTIHPYAITIKFFLLSSFVSFNNFFCAFIKDCTVDEYIFLAVILILVSISRGNVVVWSYVSPSSVIEDVNVTLCLSLSVFFIFTAVNVIVLSNVLSPFLNTNLRSNEAGVPGTPGVKIRLSSTMLLSSCFKQTSILPISFPEDLFSLISCSFAVTVYFCKFNWFLHVFSWLVEIPSIICESGQILLLAWKAWLPDPALSMTYLEQSLSFLFFFPIFKISSSSSVSSLPIPFIRWPPGLVSSCTISLASYDTTFSTPRNIDSSKVVISRVVPSISFITSCCKWNIISSLLFSRSILKKSFTKYFNIMSIKSLFVAVILSAEAAEAAGAAEAAAASSRALSSASGT